MIAVDVLDEDWLLDPVVVEVSKSARETHGVVEIEGAIGVSRELGVIADGFPDEPCARNRPFHGRADLDLDHPESLRGGLPSLCDCDLVARPGDRGGISLDPVAPHAAEQGWTG